MPRRIGFLKAAIPIGLAAKHFLRDREESFFTHSALVHPVRAIAGAATLYDEDGAVRVSDSIVGVVRVKKRPSSKMPIGSFYDDAQAISQDWRAAGSYVVLSAKEARKLAKKTRTSRRIESV